MRKRRIRLRTVEDVREFVQAADRCSFDVDILNGETKIDAKSIMGVMSLDLTRELVVISEGEDAELENVMKKFACE
ncbi:MAG: HPr family phosphocarrier protein [Clostridiales bacterium]|nr:HPr family phosphocarrier protein [Clostridiales bacterium]MCC8105425.1 HPr family phosphocarrier protein [Clostridiales bacterium]